MFAALVPRHPYLFLANIRNTKIIQANIDKIVLWPKRWADISSKKINPDKRLADKNKTPNAKILNNSLSIKSKDGRDAIIPIGLFDCNFFSWILSIKD